MTKKEKPIISFVTPNYNDGNTIGKYVDSIFDQDWPAKELIIVDDGSTDNSKEVLEKLKEKYAELKVIYLDTNKGACEARNIGAKEAKGKYLSFLPADAKLYPGMARIWVETLERHPDYDFLYGGYKFVDEKGHEVFSYMSDDFDPYFLRVTNYIDGSFPLKKELFDKMGGWDPAIKSLQDWDFWLNAVFNHDAVGFFSKQVFFETTLPHPGGLSDDSHRNWIERTTQIKRKYGFPISRICVTGPGSAFHAKNVAKILQADYLPMPSFKPHNYEMIYVVGFFGNVAQCFFNTNAMRVVHWIGTDILQLQQADQKVRQETLNWIDNNVDINLCEMEATQKELADLGIKARIVPFPPQRMFKPEPMPEKFSIAVYQPYNNAEFYYPDFMKRLAKKMPDTQFYFFGNPLSEMTKDNITEMGVLNKKEMEDLVKTTSMILRLTFHDGLPLSVVEWITAGRNAITTIDMPYATNFVIEKWNKAEKPSEEELNKVIDDNVDRLIKVINETKDKGLNTEGSKYYRKLCDPAQFVKNIYKFLDLDIKKWWEEMSELWPSMEQGQETTDDIIKILKEVRELKPESIIDLGCGTGRWVDLFDVKDYTGIDFSKELIEKAKTNHPDKDFEVSDILDYKAKKKFDLVFTFATFLHVKPQDIEKYTEAVKGMGKYGLFIEPIREVEKAQSGRMLHPEIIKKQKESDFIFNVKYTFIHDYMRYFNVIKVVQLSNNRNLFVVKLDE